MNRAERRRAMRDQVHASARNQVSRDELSADLGRRLAELCADPERARRSFAFAFSVLEGSVPTEPPPELPEHLRPDWYERASRMKDMLALATAGLGVALSGGAIHTVDELAESEVGRG